MHTPLLLLALQNLTVGASPPMDTLPTPRPDSAAMATAYADPRARELVRLARGRRGAIEASVFHYTARSHQRLSVEMRGPMRDRVLYRREVASSLEWWRDRPGQVEVLGAREAIPVVLAGVRVPDDLAEWARGFVPRPGDDRLWINPTGGGLAWHPLIEGGEALYRYASGDSTVIRLGDGREVRLAELRVTPRERDVRYVAGSFWIELENHAVVRAVFRPSREFDLEAERRRTDPESEDDEEDVEDEDVPALLRPVRFDIRHITVEYGLWELRWWMPRLMAFEGHVQMGALRMPVTMELVYSDYSVEADRLGLPELPPLMIELAGDPFSSPREYAPPIRVTIPEDSGALLESEDLAPSFFAPGETIISEAELRDLTDRVAALPAPPWQPSRPRLTPPWSFREGLARYNRVEGLSLGTRLDWDLTRARLDLTGRIGLADLSPRGELGVDVPGSRRSGRLAVYHRLTSADPGARPLGLGNSITSLMIGRDDGQYFQGTGAEVRLEPTARAAGSGWMPRLRVYVERQRRVGRSTDLSLPHLLGTGGFRENLPADDADQLGLHARWAVAPSMDPTGYRWSAELDLTAASGDFTFLRPGATLRGWAPLPAGLLGAVEIAGGTSLGPGSGPDELPAQGQWFLGGPASLRGFAGGRFTGPEYARARVELASRFPAVRLTLFSDAGWAGRLESRDPGDVAVSGGVGASVLDGLVRIDLARTFRPVEQWRLELYLDALF